MRQYTQVDQHFHQLFQTIARINDSFVPHTEDHSHQTLYFDHLGCKVMGRWIATDQGNILLSFNLNTFSFEWINCWKQVLQSVKVAHRTIKDIEQEVQDGLAAIGLEPKNFSRELPYEIPIYDVADQAFPFYSKEELEPWMYYRALANITLFKFIEHLQLNEKVRIWPHHFDTGIFLELEGKLGIGFGWAIEDELVGCPYFYMSGYGMKEELVFEELPALSCGKWVVEDSYKGAILSMTDLEALPKDQATNALDQFILNGCIFYVQSVQQQNAKAS